MKEPWYKKKGIRFECQGSGKCCVSHGEFGYVYLNKKDRKRLADSQGMTTKKFVKEFCEVTEGFVHLKLTNECLFLKQNRCSVYESRPSQCRTWPFWPDNMIAKNWKADVAAFCPGVDRGKTYDYKEIEKTVAQMEDPDQYLL